MNKHLFELAKQESTKSTYRGYSRVRVGAIVVYHGTVLAKGHNENRSHTVQKFYNRYRYDDTKCSCYCNPSIHAEIQALNKIKYLDIDFSKVEIYVYREHANGEIAMSRPCPSCFEYIKSFGIKRINYTTEQGYCRELIR